MENIKIKCFFNQKDKQQHSQGCIDICRNHKPACDFFDCYEAFEMKASICIGAASGYCSVVGVRV